MFIQIHTLTQYPVSNPNRDDLGRPKTITMGGHNRLRISSQALKRAWRTSNIFKSALDGHLGTRTARLGRICKQRLIEAGVDDKKSQTIAHTIASVFGKVGGKKDEKALDAATLSYLATEELAAVKSLCDVCAKENREPSSDELDLLRANHRTVDLHLWGRMFADAPKFNTEACSQVAHAFTVHKAVVEDDFFTALDDLNADNSASAHIGEQEFGAGLFYQYVCIDQQELIHRVGEELANKAMAALLECITTVVPIGKQNSYASRPLAGYVLVEKGKKQPRTLATAFSRPVTGGGDGMMINAIDALNGELDALDKAYGKRADARAFMQVGGDGTLSDLVEFCNA